MISVEERVLTSVGIDVGSTTSHLVFSRLVLREDPLSQTKKFHVAERSILFRGSIFFTPLKLGNTEIDVERLVPSLMSDYRNAGFAVSDIDTGVVIVTGVSAGKKNAEELVQSLAKEGGRFVAAAAGPNFEAIVCAHGSGAVQYSRQEQCKLIHCDIGGGTTKISIVENGEIVATACLNIGARLVAFNHKGRVTRLEETLTPVLSRLGLDLELGSFIDEETKSRVAALLAETLVKVITGEARSDLAGELSVTPLPEPGLFAERPRYSFSGGVAEFIYEKDHGDYGDLGHLLGARIRELCQKQGLSVVEARERIRATVIGASEFTLQVSGSTTFSSEAITYPLRNLSVVVPVIEREQLSEEHVASRIRTAFGRKDLVEGDQPVVVAFHDPVRYTYEKIKVFAKGLVEALPNTIAKALPIVLVFDTDIGNSVGSILKREVGIGNVLSIDEIELEEGDFIDIGEPVIGKAVFPVVVKSLVFDS